MKYARRVVMAAMAAMMIFAFAGCGSDTNTPEGAFLAGIKALKEYDTAGMEKYITNISASDLAQVEQYGAVGDQAKELVKTLYAKLDCKVLSAQENGETATLQVEMTFLDTTQLQTNLMTAMLSSGVMGMTDGSQEEVMEKLLPAMKEAIEKTPLGEPQQIEVPMVLEEGQWKIDGIEDMGLDTGI